MQFFMSNNTLDLFKFENVYSLNLLGNLNLPVQETVIQAHQMFPHLNNLDISLSEENDVSFILGTMP